MSRLRQLLLLMIAAVCGYSLRMMMHTNDITHINDKYHLHIITRAPLANTVPLSPPSSSAQVHSVSPSSPPTPLTPLAPLPSSPPSLPSYNDALKWSKIPQGWYDDEAYTDEDKAKCRMINGSNASSGEDDNSASVLRPWWHGRLLTRGINTCGSYRTIKKCHRTSETCQWSLQGYCFNYTALNIVSFQFESHPGGLTNQHHATLKGLAIARYAQHQIRASGRIVVTLLPRLHRQSPTRGKVRPQPEDFRPFRHFFDASSILCPHDMGPIIERPRIQLIESFDVHYLSSNATALQRIAWPRKPKYPYFCPYKDHDDDMPLVDRLVVYMRHAPLATSSSSSLIVIGRTFSCLLPGTFMAPWALPYSLRIAHHWHTIADTIVTTIGATQSSPTGTNTGAMFVGLHLRRERDMCDKDSDRSFDFCRWTADQWQSCVDILLSTNAATANITNGYVATGNDVLRSGWYKPFRRPASSDYNIRWHTKLSAMNTAINNTSNNSNSTSNNHTDHDPLHGLLREELALIEELVLARSRVFIGVYRSSFSKHVVRLQTLEFEAAAAAATATPTSTASAPIWFYVDKPWPHGCYK